MEESFDGKSKCLWRLLCLELICSVVFLVCLYQSQVQNLWDSKYIDSAVEDWLRHPFSEVMEVDKKKKCPTGFEIIGKGHFWGLKAGCNCNTKTLKKVSTGSCDSK
jgi:hypothetical protein